MYKRMMKDVLSTTTLIRDFSAYVKRNNKIQLKYNNTDTSRLIDFQHE